jgi:DNA-binding transcriptional MerR regulator/uncharacterized RDD family membrane protein YckC
MVINDLETRTGLDRATIRYYEKEGMITPVRKENGYRDYSEDDLQHLLKIKLLRQLGMPLYKIKELQKGSADFQTELKVQIHLLEKKRDTAQCSTQVCVQMQTDGVSYASLNAEHYLGQLLTAQPQYPQNTVTNKESETTFKEHVPFECHPWRHYFARSVDSVLFAMLILFVQVVFFRARSDAFTMPNILALLLWIPVEAGCYALFAATPGKLAFGIRVHDRDGRKLSFTDGLLRAFGVYRYGLGWGIPFWGIWRGYKSYKTYNDGVTLEWNQDCDITYEQFDTGKDKCKPVIVFTVLIAIIISTFSVKVMPKYTSNSLNIEQFSENYNEYNDRLKLNCRKLNLDGTFVQYKGNSVVIDVGSVSTFDDFQYTLEDGGITAIQYEENHEKIFLAPVLPNKCVVASIALLGAQKGETIKSLNNFIEELNQKVNAAANAGMNNLTIEYGQLRIHWDMEYQDCKVVMVSGSARLMQRSDDVSGTAKIQFRIELIDAKTK